MQVVFGQSLGRDVTLTIQTGDARPALFAPGHDMLVLDPVGPRALTISSINNAALDVRIYAVEPADYAAFTAFARGYTRPRSEREPAPGRPISAWPRSGSWSGISPAWFTTRLEPPRCA